MPPKHGRAILTCQVYFDRETDWAADAGATMTRQRMLLVDAIPLVGGATCLDFVNTTGARASARPRERLIAYADALTWSVRAGVLDATAAKRLRRLAARDPRGAARALDRLRALREAIYRVLRAAAEGAAVPPDALQHLEGWRQADQRRRHLVPTGDGGFALTLGDAADDGFIAMAWPVVASAVELLLSGRLAQLKRCGECDWLFLDESKNGSRTWCKKDCGDRVRARRHYARTAATGESQSTS
jgi:predicted RNA-binding Zn ribbon-like protein